MRNAPMQIASLSLLAVALAAPVTAQGGGKNKTPPATSSQTIQTDQTVAAAVEEDTGDRHAGPSNGPIIVNWEFKDQGGSVNLIVNPDGSFLFSGHYDTKKPGKDIEVVLGLKSKLGAVYLFHHMGNVSKGRDQWSKQGQSAFLKEDFKTFAGEHDWRGSYRFTLTAEAKKEEKNKKEKEQLMDDCRALAKLIQPAGQRGAYLWLEDDPNKKCHQFNENWY